MAVKCDYCGRNAPLVSGARVYPHRQDLKDKKLYRCDHCDAHVGCHPGTEKPLGRLANRELRDAKMHAHAAFDPLWKSKRMSRGEAYRRLQNQLGLSPTECHIGMFDVDMCNRVVEAVKRIRQGQNPSPA